MEGLSPYSKSLVKYVLGANVIYPISSTPTFVNNLSYFRSMDSYHSVVNSNTINYAPAYLHENTKVTAATWFNGMKTYAKNSWAGLAK